MKFIVDVTSKEMIRPASPTPPHLRHYKLSFLDQVSPPIYNPMLLFYPKDCQLDNAQKCNNLKQSLSKVLTHYYLLAGRINTNDNFVDCNDDGIPFLQAEVSCKLSEVIDDPESDEFRKLLPFEMDAAQDMLLGMQLNTFACGGICMGFCVSHKIADASSTLTFLKTLAAISRGDTENIVRPEFNSATLFPPKDIPGFNMNIGMTRENVVTKRFIFSNSAVESLRANFAASIETDHQQLRPSRNEALSVFIWSRVMAAGNLKSGPSRTYLMIHAVNLRPRMSPQLSEHSFGNYYRFVITTPSSETGGKVHNLIKQLRDSVSKIDEDYVKKLQEGSEHLDFIIESAEAFLKGEMVFLSFTSLCRFPLYEVDFGWSKPIWVGSPSFPYNNLVIFTDTASGDGIEALINLNEEDMIKFQEDEELRKFAAC